MFLFTWYSNCHRYYNYFLVGKSGSQDRIVDRDGNQDANYNKSLRNSADIANENDTINLGFQN